MAVRGDVLKHPHGQSGEKIIFSDILHQFCQPSRLSRTPGRKRASEMTLRRRGRRDQMRQLAYRVPRGTEERAQVAASVGA